MDDFSDDSFGGSMLARAASSTRAVGASDAKYKAR